MSFGEFLQSIGLLVDHPRLDGAIHRCPTRTKPRKKNGAYQFFGTHGWGQAHDEHLYPVIWRDDGQIRFEPRAPAPPQVDMAARLGELKQQRAAAAQRARAIIGECTTGTHPYFGLKGFPAEQGLIDPQGFLVIPMRRFLRYESIVSVQWIDDEGAKKFLPGGAAKGACYVIGSQKAHTSWFVEGYIDGLTLRAALRKLYRDDNVVVCFSAGNLIHVAELAGEGFVFADNDASMTGQRAAEATGLKWTMSPSTGNDVNDDMLAHGLDYVVDHLRRFLSSV
ncbi:MAG: hypothetical protein ACK5XA_08550 [Tagaea sp.]